MDNQISIVDGGSKSDLFAQLLDIGRCGARRPKFRLHLKRSYLDGTHRPDLICYVLINGILSESGSGNHWLIQGYVEDGEHGLFHGYYDTQLRQGWLEWDD